MRAARQAVATALAAMAIASCRQVIGVDDPAPPITCPRASAGTEACNDCVHARCCAELATCEGDEPCRSLLECRASCSDDACRARCVDTWHRSSASSALLACESARCDDACGRVCGGVGAPIEGCKECGRSCCALGSSFAENVDARALGACRNACGTNASCREGCAEQHLEGANLALSLRECVYAACDVSGDWSCLGRVEQTRTPSTTLLTFDVRAVDVLTLAPIAGVTLRSCPADDVSCANPYAAATTDGGGRGQVEVTLRPGNGLDAFAGYLELSRDAYATALVYFAPPVTASAVVTIAMIQESKLADLATAAGISLADRGTVVAGVTDCTGMVRRGVEVKVAAADARSRQFYFGKASAGDPQFDFAATTTSDVGFGGALGVPVGRTSVDATVAGLCAKVGTADVLVRAGAVTIANIGSGR